MPVCKTCEIEKAETEFHKNANCKGGIRSVCKQCVAAERKAYREANRDKVREQKRQEKLRNKDRYAAKDREYYQRTIEKAKLDRKSWYERNKELVKERAAAWAKANPERVKAVKRKNKATRKDTIRAEYERNKPNYFARAASRRVNVKQATPLWADKEQIAEIYLIASKLNGFFTKPVVHVDHIVPLNSKLVCGLHTPANLEIISAKANLSKGNATWPNMP